MFGLGAVARVFLGAGAGAAGRRAEAVGKIAALEPWAQALTDDDMRAETRKMKDAAAGGTPLTGDLGARAFALVREAARRVLGQRPYDVQVLGGLVLMEGKIAEMRTGEGKTLVAALPTFLVALEGKGVHVVTVNDYLARRDARIVGRVHEFLGLTVGVVVPGMSDDEKRAAYACDVTYGTNSEIGFDYLRDNLRFDPTQMVQRGHHFAIVDEVDSILIDEARTPLIISGPAEDAAALYQAVDSVIPRLGPGDVSVDEKLRTATLTETGNERVEEMLAALGLMPEGGELYDGPNSHLVHHVNQALKAHAIFKRDKDYIVRDGEIVIVDEFTGRSMAGRRFSEGLHQALEAKEGVAVQPESQTLSSITYQNLFRMYSRLSGMTGTAMTEAEEFSDIYGLDVVSVPTHRPVSRIDEDDEVHANAASKYAAIARAVAEAHAAGQPVLIGTSSIEKSEVVASVLERAGFRRRSHDAPVGEAAFVGGAPSFQVLNARHHAHEALIVSMAGTPGAVTIATNMAGRGTDIQLGGSVEMRVASEIGAMPDGPERDAAEAAITEDVRRQRDAAAAAGGLLVIGTERHESRRIDNQLRGRSGRQGDPGRSRFYVSMDDDIARIFGSERMARILPSLGLADGEAIVHPWISKALEKAQKKVESSHYDTRKNLIKYDDVTNEQRKAMFAYRKEVMSGEGVHDTVEGMREDCIDAMVARRVPANSYPEQWDAEGLRADALSILNLDLPVAEWFAEEGVDEMDVRERIRAAADSVLGQVEAVLGRELVTHVRKSILLEKFDKVWREHLSALEHLRSVVGFRSYAQRDPIVEYRTDAYNMFLETVDELSREVTAVAMRLRPAAPAAEAA